MVAAFTSNEGLFLAKVSALATMIILVPVIIGLYAQKYLVHGLTAVRSNSKEGKRGQSCVQLSLMLLPKFE